MQTLSPNNKNYLYINPRITVDNSRVIKAYHVSLLMQSRPLLSSHVSPDLIEITT